MRARVTMIVDSIVVIVYYVVLLVSIIHENECLVKPYIRVFSMRENFRYFFHRKILSYRSTDVIYASTDPLCTLTNTSQI